MKILLVEPGQPAYEAVAVDTYQLFKRVLDNGTTAKHLFEDSAVMLYSDKGQREGKEPNRTILLPDGKEQTIYGTFVICRQGFNRLEALLPEQIEKYKKQFAVPQQYYNVGGDLVCLPISRCEIRKQKKLE